MHQSLASCQVATSLQSCLDWAAAPAAAVAVVGGVVGGDIGVVVVVGAGGAGGRAAISPGKAA